MNHLARTLMLIGVVVLVVALPATATAATGDGAVVVAFTDEPAEEPASESGDEGGITPAEEAPPESEEDEEQPWTARYLAPTVVALGVITSLAAALYYGLRIRGRYQVVE
jgi:hypothetical protein